MIALILSLALYISTDVYVCTGPAAYAYHNPEAKSCEGLASCEYLIVTVPLDSAINMGRTPCKVCVKTN